MGPLYKSGAPRTLTFRWASARVRAMQRRLATAVDELGFAAIQAALGLRNRRHEPSADALEDLRRNGSPILGDNGTPAVPDVTLEAVADPRGLDPAYRLSFPSAHRSPYPENNTVHMDLYLPGNGWGQGIVLTVPGVLTGARNIMERPFRMWAQALSRRGLTAALVHPPYHMRRTPAGLMSGELMFSGDLFLAFNAFDQIIEDLRATVSWALTVAPRVGFWGASLGATVGLGFLAREPRLTCAVPMIPAADFAGPIFRSALCAHIRETFSAAGGTAADVHALAAPLDPFTHPPVIARDRILFVEALYDQVCYADDLERLWQAWDRPPIARYPYGHLSIFSSREAWRTMTRFLTSYLAGAPVDTPVPALAAAA